jgi:hypothetical protein
MYSRVWRAFAVTVGVLLIAFVLMDSAAAVFAGATQGFDGTNHSSRPGTVVVKRITDPAAIDGPLHVGDSVRLEDSSLGNRLLFSKQRVGDRFAFVGTTAQGVPTRFTVTMRRDTDIPPRFWVYELAGLAFAVVGLAVALRRPEDAVARTLVALFFSLGALWISDVPWLPIWVAGALIVVHLFCQVYCAYAGLALATVFPVRSERGVRRWIERFNPWYTVASLATVFGMYYIVLIQLRQPSPVLKVVGIVETFGFFVMITIAFVIGGRVAQGADRKRAQWVAWSLAAGFSGIFVSTIQFVARIPFQDWEQWLPVTLLAIPVGLGYAIVRHRVVDIGFVVNRALVFGTVSAIVVVSFMALEWALSSVFVRVSHITSTSLELGLALVLGFSLRSIHGRVDALVDDVFFRDRHEAERALMRFAKDVAFIVEPRIAIARAHAEMVVRTGAAAAAIYVVDGHAAVRIDPAETAAPDHVGVDDPALVRMRATRTFCDLRRVGESAFAGDHAFPMCVRDAVTGCVVLAAKSNGEAYAPDELATIETVTLAIGNALDALQTAALKADVARVLFDGAPVEALRGTVDAAAWVRGVTPQPAGSLLGLRE